MGGVLRTGPRSPRGSFIFLRMGPPVKHACMAEIPRPKWFEAFVSFSTGLRSHVIVHLRYHVYLKLDCLVSALASLQLFSHAAIRHLRGIEDGA